jgi:formyltetrahydrofolate hydrolase
MQVGNELGCPGKHVRNGPLQVLIKSARRLHLQLGDKLMVDTNRFILTLSCNDRVGIVSSVTLHLASIQGFILDSQQYADLETGLFFMRVEFKPDGPRFPLNRDVLRDGFAALSKSLGSDWDLVRAD